MTASPPFAIGQARHSSSPIVKKTIWPMPAKICRRLSPCAEPDQAQVAHEGLAILLGQLIEFQFQLRWRLQCVGGQLQEVGRETACRCDCRRCLPAPIPRLSVRSWKLRIDFSSSSLRPRRAGTLIRLEAGCDALEQREFRLVGFPFFRRLCFAHLVAQLVDAVADDLQIGEHHLFAKAAELVGEVAVAVTGRTRRSGRRPRA